MIIVFSSGIFPKNTFESYLKLVINEKKMSADVELKQMHEDIEVVKADIAVIKHILSEEGELTEEAKARLAKARKTPIAHYVKL